MMGVPTVSSLLNGGAAAAPAMNNNNILLQALMNQQTPPTPVPTPAPAPQTNNSQLTQLAQLLQGRGIDANSLAGILGKQETAAAPSPPTPEKAATGYSTAYPSLSTYDYGYKTTNYGPAKDDGKRGYRPY